MRDEKGKSMPADKYGLFLYADSTFRLEKTVFRSVSSGGFSVPSEEKSAGEGTWAVEVVEDRPALVLRQDGSVVQWWHTEEGGTGIQYLNGKAWNSVLHQRLNPGETTLNSAMRGA